MISEQGIIKKDWRYIDLSFGLIYPNHYKLGISSYSIRLLYYFINLKENVVCERIFLPDKLIYPASRDYSSPNLIRSVETKILPKEFDILGFSVHYENDLKNIMWLLEKAGIPINSDKRHNINNKNSIRYPILTAGGPAITSNPLPLSKIIDCFFIGDAEPNLYTFLERCIEYKTESLNYAQLLAKLIDIEGIYVPKLNNAPKRIILKDLDKSPIPPNQVMANLTNQTPLFGENYFLEINRGCPFKCKFCISSFHNFPFRNRSFESLVKSINLAVETVTFKKFSLIGSCVSSHPNFIEICNYILEKGKQFSIPSIRIDHINPRIIELLEKSNTKTLTIAPETGSDFLRYNLGKKIKNEKIIETLQLIKASKIRNIKFYFLIGLPMESEEDIQAIIDLLKSIAELGFNREELKVNINPFIPKLNTPYQNETTYYISDTLSSLKARFQYLINELKPIRSIKLKVGDIKKELKDAKLQTLISLGDESVESLLFEYYQNGATRNALKRAENLVDFIIDEYFEKIKNGYNPWIFEIIEK
ncbi:MAG: B12-binding domain-containing radical SAM protein [Candidatus Hermodarchaeota archaeon]